MTSPLFGPLPFVHANCLGWDAWLGTGVTKVPEKAQDETSNQALVAAGLQAAELQAAE
jgi:hypothetical protein